MLTKCRICKRHEYQVDLFFEISKNTHICEYCLPKSQDVDRQEYYQKLKSNPREIFINYVPEAYLNSCNEPFEHSEKTFINKVLNKVLKLEDDTWVKGINNTGKTKLIWICFIQLVLQKKLYPSSILVAKTYDMKNEYLLSINDKFTFDVRRYYMIPMLFIDDLIASNLTPAFSNVLFSILDYRWENRRPTLVTTDADFPALVKCDQRIAARIERYKNKFETDRTKIFIDKKKEPPESYKDRQANDSPF